MIHPQGLIPSPAPVTNANEQDKVIEEMYQKCLKTMEEDKEREMRVTNWTSQEGATQRCPRVWDGVLCWGGATAGETVYLPCPDYVAGFDTSAEASKHCLENGEWYFPAAEPNRTWTNFSQCSPQDSIVTIVIPLQRSNTNLSLTQAQWVPIVKTLVRTGYSVSLITLIVAFLIMASIKKLRCPRNVLHMHLFASFMMRAFMSLLKDSLFVEGLGLSSDVMVQNGHIFISQDDHNWTCKLVVGLWQFFIMANYSWVLMEGLYLHNLIFLALFSDTSSITMYVILGWGLPVLVVVPWVVLRAILENTHCWTTNENPLFFLVIRVPIVASILINFGMFVNIVRVLLLKLRSSISEETRRYRYRRWAKSTLVLVPLFGIHYTLFLGMSYSMGVNQVVEIVWLFFDLFFASFQGFFVAVLYCFMNGEVRTEMTKLWLHHRKKKSVRGGKAQWWLSSGEPSSSRRSSRIGGALLTFPRKSRDAGSKSISGAVAMGKGFGGERGGVVDLEDRFGEGSSLKSGMIEVQLHAVQGAVGGRKFPLLGRQLSAPVGTSAADSNGGLRSKVRSDVVQGTKTMAKKWKSRLGMGSWGGGKSGGGIGVESSPYASGASYSCRTTHCSLDYGAGGSLVVGSGGRCAGREGENGPKDEDGCWPSLLVAQTELDEPSSPLFQLLNPDMEELNNRRPIHRTMSDGVPLKTALHNHFDEQPLAIEVEDIETAGGTQESGVLNRLERSLS